MHSYWFVSFHNSSSSIDYEIKNKYYSAVVRLCMATSIDKVASRDRDLLDGVIIVTPSDEKVRPRRR